MLKLSSSVVGLDATVSGLQNDLSEVLQSVSELMAVSRTRQPEFHREDNATTSVINQTMFVSEEDYDLYLTGQGISIEFKSETICFQKLRDLLCSRLFPCADEPLDPDANTTLVHSVPKIPIYTQPSVIFVPLYNVYPTSYHIESSQLPTMPSVDMHQLLDIFLTCYVGYQVPCKSGFKADFFAGEVKPFLMNAITAWACKHAAVFHGVSLEKENQVGDTYYHLARTQLTEYMFENADIDCVLTLLLLYGYQVGKASVTLSCSRQPVSYLHLGLATQIALTLEMHKLHPELSDEMQQTYRRLWSLIYFLDALTVGQTDKPSMMIEDHEITDLQQSPLPNEDMESAARVQYARCRTVIRGLYRKIATCMKVSEVEPSAVHALNIEIDKVQSMVDHQLDHISPAKRVGAKFSAQGYYKLSIDLLLLKIQLFFPMLDTLDQTDQAAYARKICFESALRIMHLVDLDAASNSSWCLYSVESSWAAAAVLKYFQTEGKDEEAVIASRHLQKLRNLLLASKISGHWPMAKLIEYIE